MIDKHVGKMGTPKRDEFEEAIRIDLALKKYDDPILFPEELAKANEMLRKTGLPKQWLKTR